MHRSTRRATLVTSVLLALIIPLLGQVPATAAAPSYVALGDSYSSGTGTRSYISDGTSCLRSTKAYPSLIAAARGYELNFRACSGAKIPDVTNTQLSALSSTTSYVSISIGGNDAGFADVLTECAMPGWMSNCSAKINTAQAFITNTLPSQLGSLYAAIRSRAPQAKVVVVGYPRVFMGEDCNAFTWFSPTEQSRLNQTADLLNAKTATAAASYGFSFANPTSRFVGHAVCDDQEWINGLSYPIVESYHPNVSGQAYGYTPTVSPALTGATIAVTTEVLAQADASADSQAALQQTYAESDRLIEPEQFLAPDLTTPHARRMARKAGVDLREYSVR